MSQKEIEVILARQLADYLATPIFIVDPQGTLIFYNEPAERILGRRFEETGEMPAPEWSTLFKPTDGSGNPIDPDGLPLMIALTERRPAHRTFWIRGLVCHPDPTVGYRIASRHGVVTYLPDHEPALGARSFPLSQDWTSGYELAAGADLLIHDAQYTLEEYADRIGFGHSSLPHALEFAALAGARHFVPFHHDPAHTDDDLDRLFAETVRLIRPRFAVTPGAEGAVFQLDSQS